MLRRYKNKLSRLKREYALKLKSGHCIETNNNLSETKMFIKIISDAIDTGDISDARLKPIRDAEEIPWDRDKLLNLESGWIDYRIGLMVKHREEVWWEEQVLKSKRVLMRIIVLAAA